METIRSFADRVPDPIIKNVKVLKSPEMPPALRGQKDKKEEKEERDVVKTVGGQV